MAWVIDIIDQAILINYVGEKIEALRAVGIRGAIEMTVLGESTRAGGTVQQRVNQVVTIVAHRVGVSEAGEADGTPKVLETLEIHVRVCVLESAQSSARDSACHFKVENAPVIDPGGE